MNAGSFFDGGKDTFWTNYGLIVAGLGFMWASIGGVIMLNIIAKKRKIKLANEVKEGIGKVVTTATVEQADEIPLSVGIDKFTIQVCLVGAVYLLTWGVCVLLDFCLGFLGDTGKGIADVFWGFNFCFGIVIALIVKKILKRLRKDKLMTRRYPNTYMLNRIAGAAFDVMIICSLAAIEVFSMQEQWIPILIVSSVIGIATLFFLRYVCKKTYPEYSDESFVTMYGTLTGTLSNGIILLRELDPKFETPAAMDQVIGSTTALIFGLPLLFLIRMAVDSPFLVLGACAVYFLFLLWVIFGRFGWLAKIFKRNKKVTVVGADESTDDIIVQDDNSAEASDGGEANM